MKIYIPSLSRVNSFTNRFSTAAQLEKTKREVFIVVPKKQAKEYSQKLEELGFPENIQILPTSVSGISKVRKWCASHAQKNGDEHLLMLDDDIRFYKRKPKDIHLRTLEPKEFDVMFNKVEKFLNKGYAAVGISPREGNNNIKEPVNENTRLIRAWAINVNEFLKCKHGRVTVMEDFDVLLQLLRKGLPNICMYDYAQGQNQTQAPGGCSEYRTHENHNESAEKLASLHDGFVRLRQKQNKTGGDFGVRTEVTIYWKKALASATGEKK